MWELAPVHKLILILVSAAMLACSTLIIACWVVTACHTSTEKKKKASTLQPLSGVQVYGSAAKNGVNLTNFKLVERPTVDSELNESGGVCLRSPPTITDGALVDKLSLERPDSGKLETIAENGKSAASRQDSSYHSMSSGRASPASLRSGRDSTGSTAEGSSPDTKQNTSGMVLTPPCSSITVSLLLTHLKQEPESGNQIAAKLAISVEAVTDLPSREYKAHCDPWVAVSVLRDRRSLRRRPPANIAYFRTKTIRHAHNPFYSQTFVADLQKNEIKDVSVLFSVMDQDRHTGPTEIGRTTVSLKEAKQTVQDPDRSTLTLFLTQPKRENGEIQFGLSYLPTAQRLSVSLTKASNLRFDKEDKSNAEKKPSPYVKLLLFSQSGRLVKKKKSTVKYGTKDPVFDETINFETEANQLETHTLMIVVLSRRELQDDEGVEGVCEGMIGVDLDSSDQESYYRFNLPSYERGKGREGKLKDTLLGVLFLGKHVRGERERDHWNKMMESPRKVFNVVHTLK